MSLKYRCVGGDSTPENVKLFLREPLTQISPEEHQTEWENNTIFIIYTLIYLKFGIADCNSAK